MIFGLEVAMALSVLASISGFDTVAKGELTSSSTYFQQINSAWVIQNNPSLPSVQALVADYGRRWRVVAQSTRAAGEADTLTISIDNTVVNVSLLRAPLPKETMERIVEASWRWSRAKQILKRIGRPHLSVSVTSDGDPLGNNLILTRLVASIISVAGAEGIYWGNASMLIDPRAFLALSRDANRQRIPGSLWLNLLPTNLSGKAAIHTLGMSAFGLPEIILEQGQLPDEKALDMLECVAERAITKPEDIRSGKWIRISGTILRVGSIASPWSEGDTVLKLAIDRGR